MMCFRFCVYGDVEVRIIVYKGRNDGIWKLPSGSKVTGTFR